MKIGLSYSSCVRDIVDGVVDINDVLVIISRTDFDPRDDDQWIDIWEGYHGGRGLSAREWAHYEDSREQDFRDVTLDLYTSGRLHRPRQFGARPIRRREYWLETVLPESELERNPAAKEAWDRFQVIAELSSVKLDKNYQ